MINTLIEYELHFVYLENGKRGTCVIEARELMDAIYDFYQSHGLKYKITSWSLKGRDNKYVK